MKRFSYLAGCVTAFAAVLCITVTVSLAPPPELAPQATALERPTPPRDRLQFGRVRVQLLPDALAQVMNSKCKVTATNPSVGTTSGDADCVWDLYQNILMQCDSAVYVTWDNSTPDTDSPKIAVGDPFPLRARGKSSDIPIKFLPVTGTSVCNFYHPPS